MASSRCAVQISHAVNNAALNGHHHPKTEKSAQVREKHTLKENGGSSQYLSQVYVQQCSNF